MHEKNNNFVNIKIGIDRLSKNRLLSYQYSLMEGFGSGNRSFGLKECVRNQNVLGNSSDGGTVETLWQWRWRWRWWKWWKWWEPLLRIW